MVCNELCGIGHSQMRSLVNVVTPEKYDAWIALQQLHPASRRRSGRGRRQGAVPQNCGSCHTLAAAGNDGKIGPDLDNLAADAAKYGKGETAADYVRESIVDPSKVVVSGFPDHVMPSTFRPPAPRRRSMRWSNCFLKGEQMVAHTHELTAQGHGRRRPRSGHGHTDRRGACGCAGAGCGRHG